MSFTLFPDDDDAARVAALSEYVGHCVTAEAYARATSGFAYGVDIGNERIQVFVPSNQSLTISNQ